MYTIYLQLHCASLYVFRRKRKIHAPNSILLPTIVASMTLFILITVQWIFSIVDTFAFFKAMNHLSNGGLIHPPSAMYDGAHAYLKMALYVAQTVVGDGFFTYRLYLVWGRHWEVLIAPVFFILSFTIFGILNNLTLSAIYAYACMFSSTVIANIMITGMITFKVWKSNRATATIFSTDPQGYSRSKAMKLTWSVLYTLLESAGLYTLCVILSAISLIFSSESFNVFLSAISPMIGIAFSLIILLVGLGKTVESSSDMTVTTLLVFRQGEIDTESVGFVNGDGRSYGGAEYGGEGEHEAQDASTDAGNSQQRNGGPVPPSNAMGV